MTKRLRHFATVDRLAASRAATPEFVPPSAQANTMRHRNADA